MARQGKLVASEVMGAQFAAPAAVAKMQAVEVPALADAIDLALTPVTMRLRFWIFW